MKKENKVKKVAIERVGSPDFSSKISELIEVVLLNHLFESLKNQYLKEFFISPSSNYEPFIRLSDLRFLSSLFSRNLRNSLKRDSGVTLEMLLLLAIPISMHCLSDKRLIEPSVVLTGVINGGNGVRKRQAENLVDFSCDCFLRFERSLYAEKTEKRRIPAFHYLGLNEAISAGSTKKKKQVRYDGMIPLVSGRWKACVVRGLFLGRDISKGETEGIQVFCRGRCLQNSSRFFKFYKYMVVCKNNQSDFGLLFFWENRNKRDPGRLQATHFRNDSLSPVVLNYYDKASLESINSADHQGDRSRFHSEREAFSNLSSFTSCEKTTPFRGCIFGLDCGKNGEEFSIPHTYSQMRNGLINRLIEILPIIEKSNLIFNGAIVIDISNSVKSVKGFQLKMKGDMPLTQLSVKKLGLASNRHLNLNEILPNYFQISLGIPKEISNRGENTTFPNQLKEKDNIHSIYSLVRLYGRGRVIPLYSAYISLLYDYFCALSTDYFFQIKYRLNGWAGIGGYTGATRIAIEQRVLKWKDNAERLLNEYILFKYNEYKNVQSNVHRWLDTTEDSSSFPVREVLNLEESICQVLIIRNNLLNNIGVSLGSNNQQSKKDFHRFLNVLFLYKMIVAEITRQKVLIYTIDYCIEKLNDIDLDKLNKIDLMKLDVLSSLFDGYIDEQILFIKTILDRKKSFFIESKLFMSEKLVGSLTELEPAVNPIYLGLPRIESIRAGFSSNAFSITGGQFWNLFLDNLNRGGGSTRDMGGNISRYISDQVDKLNFLDDSLIRNFVGSSFIPRIKRDLFLGKCNDSYLNVLENFYVGSEDEIISSNIISLIHPQLSDSLASNLSKQTAGGVAGHALTPIQSIFSNLHESTALVTHSDGLSNSISDLKRLLAGLNLSSRETIESSLYSCSSNRVDLEKTSINSDSSSDRRPQPRLENLVLNRVYQKNLPIKYFWEPEDLETSYWSLRLPLCSDVTLRSLAESIGKEVAYEDTDFADQSIRKEATFHPINFNELLKDLNRYKISWIFWKDNIGEKWSLFRDYIPWFFTLTWWRYFYDLIGKTYSEIILKISYDSTHNLNRVYKIIVEDVVDGTKAYLFQRLQSLGLRFGNDSINSIVSEIGLLIFEKIPDEAEILHSGGWPVSQFSNRSIFYYFIFSVLIVLALFKHPLSAVSGSNSFHLWKRFNTIDYLTDPTRGSYLKEVMHSPSTSQMSTRDLLIHSLNRFLNYLNNIIFFFFVKDELNSWMFHEESSDILDSKKELLTQHLVTNKILYRYVSKLNSNYDLLSNEISHEPYPQGKSNVLAYLRQFWQNDLLTHKIRKLDPAEKWAFSALERNILFSVTTRRKGSLVTIPCHDIPISPQPGLLPSKGILLVGSIETGRSSIIRDVASHSYFPVVKLPLKTLIYNRSFFTNVRGNFISKESVHRLNLVFEMAKEMSPCTLWIQDIHELNIHRSYHKLEADPKFLLCQILKSIGHRRGNSNIRENVVIATTHVPARIDPAPVAPNRLNQLINFRKSNGYQRQKEFSILLRIKGCEMEANPPLPLIEGTGSGTTGYSKRDLFFLANEALLLGTSKRSKMICSDAIELASHRQHSAASDMGNGIESGSEWEIFSHEIGDLTSKNSLIDTYLTNTYIGRNALKMRFYYLSNWYVEPSITESTFNELTLFSHILGILAGLVARDSLQRGMRKKENLIVIDKLVENDLNLACGVLENLSTNFSRSEICRGESRRSSSLSFYVPIGKPKYCSGVTFTSRSSRFTRRGGVSRLTDFELQQLPELRNSSPTEMSREINWSRKAWRLRFLRSGAYELMRVSSEPNHLYNLILLYQNRNYIPQQDFEFNKIKGDKRQWCDKSGYLFSFEKSATNVTDKLIKRLENRLDNMLLREQFLDLGISGESYNEYETHCNRLDETTRLFGGRFIWDPMLLFQPDPNIPSSRRSLLPTKKLAQRLYTIYGMRRQHLNKRSNKKIKDFFLYSEDNPKLKPDSSIKRWNNLPLDDEEERDSQYVKETSFIDIHLQYPQTFNPARFDSYVVAEDFPERFIRFRLLVHRNRWMRRNGCPVSDFLIYNMLLEIYSYLFNPFWFGGASPDGTTKQFFHESS
uniref:Ycf2 n=1 Tax=Platycerium bifurcatum TaxID=187371 RepID=A0A7U3PYA0_9MONI|nr:Ycf2 [Platycerium bifurcatum]YP_010045990.1 Ycf2 [Platycerium bifurcatum]QPG86020.1 Ycf2 [Platycerium bifurcatum]QPG86036.1 Ycf2 [Platycerium bifurcatum]